MMGIRASTVATPSRARYGAALDKLTSEASVSDLASILERLERLERDNERLSPSTAASHPDSGAAGDLFVDKTGRLWFCKGGATWKQLA